MKKIIRIVCSVLALAIIACSKEEVPPLQKQTTEPPIETPVNKAPESFDLLDVAGGSENVDVRPTFTWKAAIDPEGDKVTYDLYLDEDEDPKTLYAENLNETNFNVVERLHLINVYYWKVVAKDSKGGTTSTESISFSTRNIRLPEEPLTENAGFSGRIGTASISFKGKIWIIGGQDNADRLDDVWSSADGVIWTQSEFNLAQRTFSKRSEHTATVWKDKIWVIGGRNGSISSSEVWSSEDGVQWNLVTKEPGFAPRRGHTTLVYDSKLWVIGGLGTDQYHDVWYTEDGLTWKEAVDHAQFSPRSGHVSAAFDNKIWVIGGDYWSDVWNSTDGVHWTEITSSATLPKRNHRSMVVYDNRMWIFGGYEKSSEAKIGEAGLKSDFTTGVWSSKDGIQWKTENAEDAFTVRGNVTSLVFEDKIWLIAGYEDGYKNDVWALD